jgi:signal transduction histidine kinase
LLAHDPVAADALLAKLKQQTRSAVTDIRRLVYDLRPPALDDLGLVSALRESAAHYQIAGNGQELLVSIDAPESLPPFPAAVEVAAYRIAQEALTNVTRHAHARTCDIKLEVDDIGRRLRLEICDDGQGIAPDQPSGVGLHSMRERAAELGGTCVVTSTQGSGTRVRVELPIGG